MTAVLAATDTDTFTNDPAAHEQMRPAHDTGYRFPVGFAGFAAAAIRWPTPG